MPTRVCTAPRAREKEGSPHSVKAFLCKRKCFGPVVCGRTGRFRTPSVDIDFAPRPSTSLGGNAPRPRDSDQNMFALIEKRDARIFVV